MSGLASIAAAADGGLGSLLLLKVLWAASCLSLVISFVICLGLIRLLRGKVFRAWWVWAVSPAILVTMFIVSWWALEVYVAP